MMNRILMAAALVTSAIVASPAAASSADATQNQPTTDKERRASEIIRQMLPPESVAAMESAAPSSRFGGEFARLAYENAYVSLWTRPGLSPKERSILTIGILIGVGNERELASHVAAGLRNGLTPQQIEEMIYHATAYAGFPAASSALAVAGKVVDQLRQ